MQVANSIHEGSNSVISTQLPLSSNGDGSALAMARSAGKSTQIPATLRRSKSLSASLHADNKLHGPLRVSGSSSASSLRRRQLDLSDVGRHAKSKDGKSIVKEMLGGLPNQPVYWGSLNTLVLTGNHLVWLPESVATLVSLTELWISDNKLTELPSSIGMLKDLTLLRAANNKLQAIPASLGRLKKLQRLHLGRNQLKSLPNSICQLPFLRELLVSSNRIVHLPEDIGYLQELVKLHICKNNLWRLPDSIGWLRGLKSVKLDGNPNMPNIPKGRESAVAQFVVTQSYARIYRATWSPTHHSIVGHAGDYLFLTAILCGNRVLWLPPLLWEMVFRHFKGGDVGRLLPYYDSRTRKERSRLNGRGKSI